ncbi:MAG: homoserine kinase [Firmicutes bacterium]|nr:homoserine kinase [Bacillota bacterium]
MSGFRVVVPATTANLGPGFDCLGLALTLYNTLVVRPAASRQLVVEGAGAGILAEDETNLVWRAACHLWRRVGHPEPTLALYMHNAIPLSRGLGSSSAAIVAGLLLANWVAGEPLGQSELVALATELEGHPDNVAPALLGGLVVSALDDSRVLTARFPWPTELQLVVAVPEFELATQQARQALPATVAHGDAVFNASRVALLLAALRSGDLDLLRQAADDRLHQPYRLPLIPGAAEAREGAERAGALATVISGAGPTLLALVGPEQDPAVVGEAMRAGFAQAGVVSHYLVLQPDLQGARIQTIAQPSLP